VCCAPAWRPATLRGARAAARREIRTGVAILGSGIAGLSAAWRLAKEATTTTCW
jgi:ribulose 1,5-bisphosphate synthetase/thiazole synthase